MGSIPTPGTITSTSYARRTLENLPTAWANRGQSGKGIDVQNVERTAGCTPQRNVTMKAQADYRVVLAAKNEGLDYEDASGVYHFGLSRTGNEWQLHVPPSKGTTFERHELTSDEQARILPRITNYLSRIRWFGIFPRSYRVRVVSRPF